MRNLLDLKAFGINTYVSAETTGLRWLDFGGENPTGAWAGVRLRAMTAGHRIAYKLLVVNRYRKWFGGCGLRAFEIEREKRRKRITQRRRGRRVSAEKNESGIRNHGAEVLGGSLGCGWGLI